MLNVLRLIIDFLLRPLKRVSPPAPLGDNLSMSVLTDGQKKIMDKTMHSPLYNIDPATINNFVTSNMFYYEMLKWIESRVDNIKNIMMDSAKPDNIEKLQALARGVKSFNKYLVEQNASYLLSLKEKNKPKSEDKKLDLFDIV